VHPTELRRTKRQRGLVESIHGLPSQPRSEAASPPAGSTAEHDIPVAQSPEQAHAELLGALIAASRVYRGQSF
jgi:hypothetical protein